MSGLTSQPNLGSIVEALRFGPRDSGLDPDALQAAVELLGAGPARLRARSRATCAPGASEVYVHGMPGGQYTNLREQARSLGIDDTRWHEVARAYAQVNEMFGDIVKVTPSSKVVGDMALMMVTSGSHAPSTWSIRDDEVAFPESVVALFRGDIGQPHGGFPPALQKKVLRRAAAARRGRRDACRRSTSSKARAELQAGCRARSPTTSSRPGSCTRRCSPTTWPTACISATRACCRRGRSSTAWSPARRSRSISSAAST